MGRPKGSKNKPGHKAGGARRGIRLERPNVGMQNNFARFLGRETSDEAATAEPTTETEEDQQRRVAELRTCASKSIG